MKAIAKTAIKKSFDLVGLELRRKPPQKEEFELEEGSLVVPRIWDQPLFQAMIPLRLQSLAGPLVLLGSPEQIEFLRSGFVAAGREVQGISWDWETQKDITPIPEEALIIVCKLPKNERHWRVVKQLKQQFGSRVIGIQELVLPFTTLQEGLSSFEYSVDSFAEIVPLYLGQEYFGPLDILNDVFPLSGKTVIEFGPMECAQTAGLVDLGVKSVIGIEARATSFIKSMIACYCFGWKNVSLVMDDFHNADAEKYGRFDLVFAHGVYYHSFAPFLFFENLMSLADNVFIGGYTTNASQPAKASTALNYTDERLEYEGKQYRVRQIRIGNSFNTAINQFAYHFDRDDLLRFFEDRGYDLTLISDEPSDDPWGDWFLRFLAKKSTL
ncbi:MAG TPA: class I SAM-dependent methyltransferase [Candidatus Saccharimonadales bacterium]|nr:class I SAM-dependent methyltransferase [Candidatus Saccharimonadales bacterium]